VSTIGAITYEGFVAVTQSDSAVDPSGPFAAIEATGGSGTVKVTCIDGSIGSVYLPQGLIKPIAVKQVWNTGTTGGLSIVGYHSNPYRQPINPGTGTVLP
jgi:hypothetical protein